MGTRGSHDGFTEITGTIYGSYDYGWEGKGAWVGHAILTIGDRPPVTATFIDRSESFARKPNGDVFGTETMTLSFPDGATFDVHAAFTGTARSTPGLFTFQETGWIVNGTGAYSGVAGHVVLHGPFVVPDPAVTPGAPPWIAEMHGVVQGLS